MIICVLLSSYNGERFIREQLDSIFSQKNVEIKLVVRDDGSTDKTKKILSEYSGRNDIDILYGENIGVGRSFMSLLYNSPDADYYAFSDQDDIWLEDKLSRAIQMISEREKERNIPLLYASNQILVDSYGRRIGMRYTQLPSCGLFDCIVCNYLSGCTMVMNKKMRNQLIEKRHVPNDEIIGTRIHDTWCMMVANIVGEVVLDQDSRILYRQHENNVVGAAKKKGIELLKDKWKRLTGAKYKGIRSACARELERCFDEQLDDKTKNGLSIIANANSFIGGIMLIKNKEIKSCFHEGTMILFLKALMGWI